jgi:hypothetical protein
MVERPQDTGCTSIEIDTNDEILDEGVANGILSMVSSTREVEYDEKADVYRVGEKL